jgi:hypothetical protein
VFGVINDVFVFVLIFDRVELMYGQVIGTVKNQTDKLFFQLFIQM